MSDTVVHLHLDPVGGLAGDMFAAALLDGYPDLEQPLLSALAMLDVPSVAVRVVREPVGGFAGARFVVERRDGAPADDHRHWADIRAWLLTTSLAAPVRDLAIDVFGTLAAAEGAVHGVPDDDVHFHEVGAWDSIVDIVAAAFLVDAISPMSWSLGSLPIGGGTVSTDHGVMPVPAPATARLLRGFEIVDDGIAGERVTPTGAAIAACLRDKIPLAPCTGRLSAMGMGFGSRTLPDRPNVLRILASTTTDRALDHDRVTVIRFEIDDQTGEDLAVALETLRATDGVLDVIQFPTYGKKGRIAVSVQVLARPVGLNDVVDVIFAETTTLGIRIAEQGRMLLRRSESDVDGIGVKVAMRSDTVTAKAEIAGLVRASQTTGGGHAARETLRKAVEQKATEQGEIR